MNDEPPILVALGLKKTYPLGRSRLDVLRGIDLELRRGEALVVVGASGAGKSTLLKACLGLLPTATGHIQFYGQSLDAARSKIAYVPQRESVDWNFPINALDVAAMGLYQQVGWLRMTYLALYVDILQS